MLVTAAGGVKRALFDGPRMHEQMGLVPHGIMRVYPGMEGVAAVECCMQVRSGHEGVLCVASCIS